MEINEQIDIHDSKDLPGGNEVLESFNTMTESFHNIFEWWLRATNREEADKLNQQLRDHEKHIVMIFDIGVDGIPNAWFYSRTPEQKEGGDFLFNLTGKQNGQH